MKKNIIIIISFCACFELTAQSVVSTLVQKFDAYQAILPKTKLHLVFNQDKYSPGDTAFFKAYFLKEDLHAIAGKQLIDLNLVDSKGESKLHLMFNVNNGVGQNQLVIPNSIPAGIYLVTAHSSWMKNFNPVPFFKKEIIVVIKNAVVPSKKNAVSVIAEGRHLIKGLSGKVIIRTYKEGSIVKITDGAGVEIDHVTTDSNGLCSAVLAPRGNRSYFIRVDGDSAKIPLLVEDNGCSLRLTPSGKKEEPIKVAVTSPPGSTLRHEELILIVSSRGKIYHTATFIQGERDGVELQIPQRDLPEGITQLSLLKPNGNLLASRDFYCQGDDAIQVKILTDKNDCVVREKVRAEVSLTDKAGRPIEGEFSVKVLNADLFDSETPNSMADELTILSPLREKYLIDRSDSNWMAKLDNYLISVTEEIPWKEIEMNTITKPRFTFSNFVQKSGKAFFAETHEPVPDPTTITFYLQRSKIRYQTTTEKGKVWLAIPDLHGQDELFYFGETFFYFGGERHGQGIPNLKIEWDEEPTFLPRSIASKESEGPDRYAAFASKRRLIDRSYSFYTSANAVDDTNVTGGIDFETEVKGADVNLNVQNYIIFPTMAELIKEVIPSLQYRKSNGKDMVIVSLSESMAAMATGDPVYVIDGIATKNTAFFLSLRPADLLSIKIITDPSKLLRFNLLGKNGIVIVQTRNGDVREPLGDSPKLIEGINRPVSFKVGDNTSSSFPRRPDFRSTIYWNPSLKTDSNGKAMIEFLCSDDIGTLSIRVDGITKGGMPFSATGEMKVDQEKKAR
jgi:hypothetical protein